MEGQFWFKPKTFGYGATPSTWQGWASVLVFVTVVVGLSWALLGSSAGLAAWTSWVLLVAAATVGFVAFTKRKTDGEWRWRSGTCIPAWWV